MFATDRDLLVFEPGLLAEVAWAGQRVYSTGSATVQSSGAQVSDSSGPFQSFGLGVGSTLLLDGLAVEIVGVTSSTIADISLIRASTDDPAIEAPLSGTVKLEAYTFAAQIGLVHRQLLGALGLEPGTTAEGGPLAADRVVDTETVARAESLGALHTIYSSAVPLTASGSALQAKADRYRDRFRAARLALAVGVDLDGDGVADSTRRIGTAAPTRR